MRASLRNVLLSTATAIGMFTASLSAAQAANDFTTETDAHSLLGSYLAANLAKGANDNNSAAAFYRSALALDPDNAVLLEQAFQTEAAEGQLGPRRAAGPRARRQERRQPHGATCCSASTASRTATTRRPTRSSRRRATGPSAS